MHAEHLPHIGARVRAKQTVAVRPANGVTTIVSGTYNRTVRGILISFTFRKKEQVMELKPRKSWVSIAVFHSDSKTASFGFVLQPPV